MLQVARARGGVEIRARGVGWDSGPGREVWIRAPGAGLAGIRAPGAGWGGDSGPGAGWGGFRAGARGGNYLG